MEFQFSDEHVKITEHHVDGTSPTPASNDLFTLTDEPLLPSDEQIQLHSLVAQLHFLESEP
jgi:hypothetical protein